MVHNQVLNLVGLHNHIKLTDLIEAGGGYNGYLMDIGGDERGYFGCTLQLLMLNGSRIVINQRVPMMLHSPHSEFKAFLKRYSALLGRIPNKSLNPPDTGKRVIFNELILSE